MPACVGKQGPDAGQKQAAAPGDCVCGNSAQQPLGQSDAPWDKAKNQAMFTPLHAHTQDTATVEEHGW
eukprot:350440-Chlamydomonas_euryale.AAC.4